MERVIGLLLLLLLLLSERERADERLEDHLTTRRREGLARGVEVIPFYRCRLFGESAERDAAVGARQLLQLFGSELLLVELLLPLRRTTPSMTGPYVQEARAPLFSHLSGTDIVT